MSSTSTINGRNSSLHSFNSAPNYIPSTDWSDWIQHRKLILDSVSKALSYWTTLYIELAQLICHLHSRTIDSSEEAHTRTRYSRRGVQALPLSQERELILTHSLHMVPSLFFFLPSSGQIDVAEARAPS